VTFTALMLGVTSGLALASIYVLIAMSLTLILAASGIFSFVQGTIVMLGTIWAFMLGVQFGLPWLVIVAAIMLLGVASGLLTYLISVWPAFGRAKSLTETTMLTTIGLGTAVNAIAAQLFGPDPHRVAPYLSDSPIIFLGIPLRPIYLAAIAIGGAVTITIEIVIRRTELGRIFRATLEDPEGARLLGINTRTVVLSAFGLGGAMAALAGFLIAPITAASAFNALDLAFFGFAGMAIGGFGSFAGALVGGVMVGLLSGILPVIGVPHLVVPLCWLIVVLVLLFRPAGLWGAAGLFGARRLREV
jgi:branched-subunit amino acid ABC-type transport system permease component